MSRAGTSLSQRAVHLIINAGAKKLEITTENRRSAPEFADSVNCPKYLCYAAARFYTITFAGSTTKQVVVVAGRITFAGSPDTWQVGSDER
jgi:hypothetical protein